MNREQIKPNHYHGDIEAWWTPKHCFMCRAVKADRAELAEWVEKNIDHLCEVMHITYETEAIKEGWRTQEITRGEWANSPESNKATMRKSVKAVALEIIEGEK